MLIQPLGAEHIEDVARLHSASLTGLLARLGARAVRAFYAGAVKTPLSVGYACMESGSLRGFVLGAVDSDGLRTEVMRSNRLQVLVGVCAGVLRRPTTLRWLLSIGKGPGSGIHDRRQPELIYLAVAADGRGNGIGKMLVNAFGEAMQRAGVDAYELSVDDDNDPAIRFYERLGFELVGRYREYGNGHRRYRLTLGQSVEGDGAPADSAGAADGREQGPGPSEAVRS
jgi:ribosomal protein S18 acetylase RimI-like enzyme